MTDANLISRIEEIVSIPYNTSNWDYSQFAKPNEFQWKVGITPFSNWQFVVGVWATYFVTIIGLKAIMSSTTPFSMRYVTAAHNLMLCLLSAIMFGYAERGIGECFCTSDSSSTKGRLFYVTYVYYLSKFDELLDTVILVLKKKPIIFLHWYHHAIVILMVWSWLEDANMYARHVQTSQVLVTVGRVIQSKYLRQIKDVTLRPHKLRKDHWTPFVAISGFSSYGSVMTTSNIILRKLQNRPKSSEYYKTEKRLRIHEDMNLVEPSVLALCQSLRQLEARDMESKQNSILKIYWERMAMVDLPKEKNGMEWPKFVQHDKLELKRGRLFLNKEFKWEQKPLAVRNDRKDARLKRGIYSRKANQENQVMEQVQ
ncbi:17373_t:CDS:2 [Funneliformis geosporum]|uniref:Elongation of fatty acids protein n=1 Tax=Funneliformis geosporum TaxID=1117311 RepID=A0A9W4WRB3_9GLOM|nr:5946_t:CDS:2 [Funneliformis geosporum]CAI2167907.1 17373_t:CDS:2 [Funneliformis geosporum]